MDFLQGKAQAVAARVVREEEGNREHVVIALSGAHAYGFPSPDSDLDLKAIHCEPTAALLGLERPREAFDRMEWIDGVEVDYTSNELRGVLAGVASGNGNYLERIWGELICATSAVHEELKSLWPQAISRRVHGHYRGFAANQRKAFENAEHPTAKKLLYVLRTALTGTHLLRAGELRVDLNTTMDEYGFADACELIEAKKAGEQSVLEERERERWSARLDGLFSQLDAAHESSSLPDDADTAALEAWLVGVRKRQLIES